LLCPYGVHPSGTQHRQPCLYSTVFSEYAARHPLAGDRFDAMFLQRSEQIIQNSLPAADK